MYRYGIYGSSFIFLIPAILIAMYAQNKIQRTYNQYAKIAARRGYSGQQVARMILDRNDLRDVDIELVGGKLTDHYDPRKRVLRLSSNIYNGNSLAAFGIAAHEVGHAIQHSKHYIPLQIRNTIAPVASLGSRFVWILVLLGLFMGNSVLVNYGILLYIGVVLFQFVTLPVEFNASSRAIAQLEGNNLLYEDEIPKAKKVLSAAALTYVAATLVAIAQLIRLLSIAGYGRRD